MIWCGKVRLRALLKWRRRSRSVFELSLFEDNDMVFLTDAEEYESIDSPCGFGGSDGLFYLADQFCAIIHLRFCDEGPTRFEVVSKGFVPSEELVVCEQVKILCPSRHLILTNTRNVSVCDPIAVHATVALVTLWAETIIDPEKIWMRVEPC